jgi:type I restriction enzyme R subunit
MTFPESTVEQATLVWLESVGWSIRHGTETALGELAAERSDYRQVVLEQRLRDGLLQELISSELRLRYAERFIGRAAA